MRGWCCGMDGEGGAVSGTGHGSKGDFDVKGKIMLKVLLAILSIGLKGFFYENVFFERIHRITVPCKQEIL